MYKNLVSPIFGVFFLWRSVILQLQSTAVLPPLCHNTYIRKHIIYHILGALPFFNSSPPFYHQFRLFNQLHQAEESEETLI